MAANNKPQDNKENQQPPAPSQNPPPPPQNPPSSDESKDSGGLEPKQAVITPADTSGAGPRKLRAPGFKGSYKGYVFNDEGESATPVPADVESELRAQYPRLAIQEIE